MEQFKTLYRYELKKITGKKLFRITLALFLLLTAALIVMQLTGKYYVDGEVADTHYHMFLVDREYEKALSGRAIDQTLLEETMAGYGKIKDIEGRYTLTEEYQTCARPYSAIYQLIARFILPFYGNTFDWKVDEASFYHCREMLLEQQWKNNFLTDGEMNFWRKKEALTAHPYTYYYHEGYAILGKAFNGFGILIPLFVSVCLSNVFAEEHVRRTDQLILSGVNGKSAAYLAKILAGITVSVSCTALTVLTAAVLSLTLYGAEGFDMPIQATPHLISYPMTIGESCLILAGISLVLAVALSVFVMLLSEALHSGVATLAVSTGLILLVQMFSVPPQYRVFSQIWNWLPYSFLNRNSVFDQRTLPLFGHYLISWQIVPVLYLLGSLGLVLLGKKIYRNYQVAGR